MKVLVAGGAGYIGAIVSAELVAAGHEVMVYDSLVKGHREAVPRGAQLTVGDLHDRQTLDAVMDDGGVRCRDAFCGFHRSRRVDGRSRALLP